MSNPAEIIISKFGGAPALAEILDVDPSRVYRWAYPRERGGTDGHIPSKRQSKILEEAKKRGIKVSPADFFPREG